MLGESEVTAVLLSDSLILIINCSFAKIVLAFMCTGQDPLAECLEGTLAACNDMKHLLK